MKVLVYFALVLIAALGVAGYAGRDLQPEELEARFAQPPSRFVTLDGVRVHFRDEGQGPAILLLHGPRASLLMWEPWAEELRERYRVVRFDLPGCGLTGPDPTGDYSLERTIELVERFADRMGLERFALGGASVGATAAIHYTAAHEERVARLIVVGPDIGFPRSHAMRAGGPASDASVSWGERAMARFVPRLVTEELLRHGFADPARVSDELVEEWHLLWRRQGNRRAELMRLRQYDPGDVGGSLRRIRAPVLLLWGALPEADADMSLAAAREQLVNAHSVRVEIVRGTGALPVLEDPHGTARRARDFLDAGNADVPFDPLPEPDSLRPMEPELPIDGEDTIRAAGLGTGVKGALARG